VKASLPKDMTPADLTPEQIEQLLKQKVEGPDKLGLHPETGEPIYILLGSYGPYVQLGEATAENKKPKRASLPKTLDMESITLEMAVDLLALPRLLGQHPETGCKVQVGLGRFGPYVVHDQGKEGKDYRSLKKEDDLFTISLERALELLAMPKATRGRRSQNKKALKELGNHPDDAAPVNVYDGPYGPYIQHNKTNVSIPDGQTIEALTLEIALPLLAAKATTKGKKKSASRTQSTTQKSTPKKTARKTTQKKTVKKTAK
jgi:DNA topoisomerase-1